MKTLLSYLGRYKKESLLGPLFKLLEATLELIVPLIVAAIVDRGIGGEDRAFIVRASIYLIVFGLVGLGFSLTAQYFAAKAAVGCVRDLRASLFTHVTSLAYADVDRIGTSTLITRLSADARQVQTGINLALRLLLRSPFVVFGAMIMAFTVDTAGATTFVVLIPALSVVVFGIMLLSMPMYKRVRARLDGILLRVRENLTGVRVVRAFCKEDGEAEAFAREHEALTRAEKRVGRLGALLNPLTYVLVNLAVIVLLHVGAIRVDNGTLTQGQVIALYNYMSQILVELVKLADLIITMTKAAACAGRMQAVLRSESSLPDTEGSLPAPVEGEPHVAFSHVSFRYPGAGSDSLTDVTFTAHRGETIGIIGGTGSGKSTLIQLIPRLYDVKDGSVTVDGHDVRDLPTREHRARVGTVMQRSVLLRGTVRDNLAFGGKDASDERMTDALAAAQIKDTVDRMQGLDTPVEQGGINFSGGQRQRLSVARTLTREPEILILDDASSALDYATDAALRRAVRELPYHPTVFLVSQRASTLRTADRILVLDEGHLVGVGTHAELLGSCDVYREICQSQGESAGGGVAS